MEVDRAVYLITSVLYELQPVRAVDIYDFAVYVTNAVLNLSSFSLEASDAVYAQFIQAVSRLSSRAWMYFSLWVATWMLFIYLDFGSLWIILSLMLSIFFNLGTRKAGELSAYSVFNKDFKKLLGTLDARDIDNEIRHNSNLNEDADDRDLVDADDVMFDDEGDRINDDQHQAHLQQIPAAHLVKKRGKKARRTYEKRLERKRQQQLLEHQLQRGEFIGDEDFVFDDDDLPPHLVDDDFSD